MSAAVDDRVRVLLTWLNTEPISGADTIAILVRALAIWVEAIPEEERPPLVEHLRRALESVMDVIDLGYLDDLAPASPPMTRQ